MAKAPALRRFVFATDLHWGYERKGGRLVALHDLRALSILLRFIDDFNPHDIVLGGDMLDCSAISHHNDRKPGRVEGLRLFRDASELRTHLLEPLERRKRCRLTYITGNHEDWLNQLVDAHPGLEGVVGLDAILRLGKWKVIPQGGSHRLGKLVFKHGDQISGGEHCAKAAVIAAERSVRFGHFHTYQAFTKTSDVDSKQKHTGIAMPCLCRKGPGYGKGKANKWVNGFGYGYILPDGTFSDYAALIVNNQAVIHGKAYKG